MSTTVTRDMIQKLREKTNVGMMDCKKALISSNGDMEEAVKILREKGVAVAAKRSDNATDHGCIDAIVSGNSAAIAEVSCETDFSARTDDMKSFVKNVVNTAASSSEVSSASEILDASVESAGISVQGMLNELISKISENIKLSRVRSFNGSDQEMVNVYVHPDHSVAAMIALEADRALSDDERQSLKPLAKDLCMQIAVTDPVAIRAEDVDQDLIAKEREVAKNQMLNSGKPEQMIEKIVEGKIKKFCSEVCLEGQNFIKDEKLSVKQKLDAAAKDLGAKLKVSRFERFGIKR